MSLADTLKSLLEQAGESGLDELKEALEELRPDNDLQKVALGALVGALDEHGVDAIEFAAGEIVNLLDGEDAQVDYSKLSPRARSDLLVAMQTEEADSTGARVYMEAVADHFGRFATAVLKILLA